LKRTTFAVVAASLVFASAAIAGTGPEAKPAESARVERRAESPRYANTAERWRGRPTLRAAGVAHPADEASPSERVFEFVPSANFMLEGQNGGAFALPSL